MSDISQKILRPSRLTHTLLALTISLCSIPSAMAAVADADRAKIISAADDFKREHYAQAARTLNSVSTNDAETKFLTNTYLGEVHYREGRYKEAIQDFEKALALVADLSPRRIDTHFHIAILERLCGAYQHEKDFAHAVSIAQNIVILNRATYGDTDLRYGFALLCLADNQRAMPNANKSNDWQSSYEKAIWIFRHSNYQRLLKENNLTEAQDSTGDSAQSKSKIAERQALRKTLMAQVFGKGNIAERRDADQKFAAMVQDFQTARAVIDKQTPDATDIQQIGFDMQPPDYNESPGYVWTNPHRPQKGVILCIHGLGLHHRAFDSFARVMARFGYTTVAFDVRGFGVYTQSLGKETLDMKSCIEDLSVVTRRMRRDYADVPVFLLGESMGGALALEIAAKNPQNFGGLVLSVPAAKRTSEVGTKMKVALGLVTDSNKPINLKNNVVKKSTSDETLRQAWSDDPSAKLRLSPKELFAFDSFMRDSHRFAPDIKTMPVLMFQGNDDKLVKRDATLDLFQNLGAQDKIMVLVGNSEHLIFEAPQFKEGISYGIIGWLNAKAVDPQKD